MPGYDSQGYEIGNVLLPKQYPLPRRGRVGPPSSLETQVASVGPDFAAPPRARVFPWVMNITANSRRTLSTPLLLGPAILRKIFFGPGTVTTPPAQTLELGWAPGLVTEAGVALTAARPYTVLTELLDPFAVSAAAKGTGLLADNSANTHVRYEWSLDLIVTEVRFCFTLAWVNNAATAEQRGGQLLVLEAVNPEALRLFTGS